MRPLRRVPVPPGAAGVEALMTPLRSALDGSGPAIAPVPVVTATVSNDYAQMLLDALRPDDPGAPLESDEVALVVATSGSTGSPKGVLLTATAVTALTPVVVAGSGDAQWIAALPLTSMGGLNVLVRSLASTRVPIALPSIGGAQPFRPADFSAAVAQADTDDIRVSLVAAQVRRLLDEPEGTAALRACTQVLVGAGPTPDALVATARDAGIAITLTYGSTETSGGCVYDGVPLPGVHVAVDDDGQVVIDGPMLARGYRLDPAATAERFGPAGFRTNDLGTFVDGRLSISGRADDVVIVNGVNVSLGAVERALESCPGVAQALVVAAGTTHAPELVAVVVARGSTDELRATAVAHVERRLGRAAMPRRVAAMPELPLLPNGKVDRRAVRTAVDEGHIAWLP